MNTVLNGSWWWWYSDMLSHWTLPYFPFVAVINIHKCNWKQYVFILPQFWRSEAWNQFHWAEVKVSAQLALSGEAEGDGSLPPLALRGRLLSFTRDPFLSSVQPLALILLPPLWLCRVCLDVQGNRPISRSARSLLSYKVNSHRFQRLGQGHLGRSIILLL